MQIIEEIINNKSKYYSIAIEYLKSVESEVLDIQDIDIKNKSLSYIIDHLFLPTPCVEIRLDLHSISKNIKKGSYYLYVDFEKSIVDEFLILDQ